MQCWKMEQICGQVKYEARSGCYVYGCFRTSMICDQLNIDQVSHSRLSIGFHLITCDNLSFMTYYPSCSNKGRETSNIGCCRSFGNSVHGHEEFSYSVINIGLIAYAMSCHSV